MLESIESNSVRELLRLIGIFCDRYDLSEVAIAGDVPRYLVLGGREPNKTDIICSSDEDVPVLATVFATEILSSPVSHLPNDKRAIVKNAELGIALDFQCSSPKPYVDELRVLADLKEIGLDDSSLVRNLAGRSFTIDSFLYLPETESVHDPLLRGSSDVEDEKVCSILSPDVLMRFDPWASLAAIQRSLEFDFDLDLPLQAAIQRSPNRLMSHYGRSRTMNNIGTLIGSYGENAIKILRKCGFDECVRKIVPEEEED